MTSLHAQLARWYFYGLLVAALNALHSEGGPLRSSVFPEQCLWEGVLANPGLATRAHFNICTPAIMDATAWCYEAAPLQLQQPIRISGTQASVMDLWRQLQPLLQPSLGQPLDIRSSGSLNSSGSRPPSAQSPQLQPQQRPISPVVRPLPPPAPPWELDPTADAWVLDAVMLGDAEALGLVADLTQTINDLPGNAWLSMEPLIRRMEVYYNGRAVAVPLGWSSAHLVYRKDVLERANATVPVTWPEAVWLARHLNGTDMDGDGIPDYGWCAVQDPGCAISSGLLHSVWGAYAVSLGTQQGLHFDPRTMLPQLLTAAFIEAVRVTGALAAFGPPTGAVGNGCLSMHPSFVAGRCAMTLAPSWSVKAAVARLMQPPLRPGSGSGSGSGPAQQPQVAALPTPMAERIGVADVPGSELIWDAHNDVMTTCVKAPSLCPYAVLEDTPNGTPLLEDALLLPYGQPRDGARRVHRALINRAPIVGARSIIGVVSSRASPYRQQLALNALALMSGTVAGDAMMLDPRSAAGPYRTALLEDLAPWLEAGYPAAATQQLLGSARRALFHPNAVGTLRVPGGSNIRSSMNWVADNISATSTQAAAATISSGLPLTWRLLAKYLTLLNGAAFDAAAGAQTFVEQLLDGGVQLTTLPAGPLPGARAAPGATNVSVTLTAGLLQAPYWYSITSKDNIYSKAAPKGKSISSGNGWMFLQVGVPIISLGCIVATVLLIMHTRQAKGKAYYAIDPPGLSPDTTLVVTDIEGSTTLWEELEASVMDQAIKVHHSCLRSLLRANSGYEACTEGDSFILAFYSSGDALRFALASQQALLEAKWPAQLLEHSACSAVWALPAPHARAEGHGSPIKRTSLLPGLMTSRTSAVLDPGALAPAPSEALSTPTLGGGNTPSGLFGPLGTAGTPGNGSATAAAPVPHITSLFSFPRQGSGVRRNSSMVLPGSGHGSVGGGGVPNSAAHRSAGGSTLLGFALLHGVLPQGSSDGRAAQAGAAGSSTAGAVQPAASQSALTGDRRPSFGSSSHPFLTIARAPPAAESGASSVTQFARCSTHDTTNTTMESGSSRTLQGAATAASSLLAAAAAAAGGFLRGNSALPVGARFNKPRPSSKASVRAASEAPAAAPFGGPPMASAGSAGAMRAGHPAVAALAAGVHGTGGTASESPGSDGLMPPTTASAHGHSGAFSLPTEQHSAATHRSPGSGTARSGAKATGAQPSTPTGPEATFSGMLPAPAVASLAGSSHRRLSASPLSRVTGFALPRLPPPPAQQQEQASSPDPEAAVAAAPRVAGGRLRTAHPLPATALQQSPFAVRLARVMAQEAGSGANELPGSPAAATSAATPHNEGEGPGPRSETTAASTGSPAPDAAVAGAPAPSAQGDAGPSSSVSAPIAIAGTPLRTAASGWSAGLFSPSASQPVIGIRRTSLDISTSWRRPLKGLLGTRLPSAAQAAAAAEASQASAAECRTASGLLPVVSRSMSTQYLAEAGGAAPAGSSPPGLGSSLLAGAGSLFAGGLQGLRASAAVAQRWRASSGGGLLPDAQGGGDGAVPGPERVTAGLTAGVDGGTLTAAPSFGAVYMPVAVPFHKVLSARWVLMPCVAGAGGGANASGAGSGGGAGGPPAPPAPGSQLILLGLRVRMGLHSGLCSTSELTYNRAAARMVYAGNALLTAKAVSDAGNGGCVVLSGTAFARLSHWMLNNTDQTIWFAGRHKLKDSLPALDLYCAFSRALLPRTAALPVGVRSKEVVHPPVQDALVGSVSVASLRLVGAQTLLHWNAPLAQRALGMFEGVALQLLRLLGGTLFEVEPGCMTASFGASRTAMLWLLHCQALLLAVPWEPELLMHALCEAMTFTYKDYRAVAYGQRPTSHQVSFAGPRVKGAVDVGLIKAEVHRPSARLLLGSRPRTRLLKLLTIASPGQVVCSSACEAQVVVGAAGGASPVAEARPVPQSPSLWRGKRTSRGLVGALAGGSAGGGASVVDEGEMNSPPASARQLPRRSTHASSSRASLEGLSAGLAPRMQSGMLETTAAARNPAPLPAAAAGVTSSAPLPVVGPEPAAGAGHVPPRASAPGQALQPMLQPPLQPQLQPQPLLGGVGFLPPLREELGASGPDAGESMAEAGSSSDGTDRQQLTSLHPAPSRAYAALPASEISDPGGAAPSLGYTATSMGGTAASPGGKSLPLGLVAPSLGRSASSGGISAQVQAQPLPRGHPGPPGTLSPSFPGFAAAAAAAAAAGPSKTPVRDPAAGGSAAGANLWSAAGMFMHTASASAVERRQPSLQPGTARSLSDAVPQWSIPQPGPLAPEPNNDGTLAAIATATGGAAPPAGAVALPAAAPLDGYAPPPHAQAAMPAGLPPGTVQQALPQAAPHSQQQLLPASSSTHLPHRLPQLHTPAQPVSFSSARGQVAAHLAARSSRHLLQLGLIDPSLVKPRNSGTGDGGANGALSPTPQERRGRNPKLKFLSTIAGVGQGGIWLKATISSRTVVGGGSRAMVHAGSVAASSNHTPDTGNSRHRDTSSGSRGSASRAKPSQPSPALASRRTVAGLTGGYSHKELAVAAPQSADCEAATGAGAGAAPVQLGCSSRPALQAPAADLFGGLAAAMNGGGHSAILLSASASSRRRASASDGVTARAPGSAAGGAGPSRGSTNLSSALSHQLSRLTSRLSAYSRQSSQHTAGGHHSSGINTAAVAAMASQDGHGASAVSAMASSGASGLLEKVLMAGHSHGHGHQSGASSNMRPASAGVGSAGSGAHVAPGIGHGHAGRWSSASVADSAGGGSAGGVLRPVSLLGTHTTASSGSATADGAGPQQHHRPAHLSVAVGPGFPRSGSAGRAAPGSPVLSYRTRRRSALATVPDEAASQAQGPVLGRSPRSAAEEGVASYVGDAPGGLGMHAHAAAAYPYTPAPQPSPVHALPYPIIESYWSRRKSLPLELLLPLRPGSPTSGPPSPAERAGSCGASPLGANRADAALPPPWTPAAAAAVAVAEDAAKGRQRGLGGKTGGSPARLSQHEAAAAAAGSSGDDADADAASTATAPSASAPAGFRATASAAAARAGATAALLHTSKRAPPHPSTDSSSPRRPPSPHAAAAHRAQGGVSPVLPMPPVARPGSRLGSAPDLARLVHPSQTSNMAHQGPGHLAHQGSDHLAHQGPGQLAHQGPDLLPGNAAGGRDRGASGAAHSTGGVVAPAQPSTAPWARSLLHLVTLVAGRARPGSGAAAAVRRSSSGGMDSHGRSPSSTELAVLPRTNSMPNAALPRSLMAYAQAGTASGALQYDARATPRGPSLLNRCTMEQHVRGQAAQPAPGPSSAHHPSSPHQQQQHLGAFHNWGARHAGQRAASASAAAASAADGSPHRYPPPHQRRRGRAQAEAASSSRAHSVESVGTLLAGGGRQERAVQGHMRDAEDSEPEEGSDDELAAAASSAAAGPSMLPFSGYDEHAAGSSAPLLQLHKLVPQRSFSRSHAVLASVPVHMLVPGAAHPAPPSPVTLAYATEVAHPAGDGSASALVQQPTTSASAARRKRASLSGSAPPSGSHSAAGLLSTDGLDAATAMPAGVPLSRPHVQTLHAAARPAVRAVAQQPGRMPHAGVQALAPAAGGAGMAVPAAGRGEGGGGHALGRLAAVPLSIPPIIEGSEQLSRASSSVGLSSGMHRMPSGGSPLQRAQSLRAWPLGQQPVAYAGTGALSLSPAAPSLAAAAAGREQLPRHWQQQDVDGRESEVEKKAAWGLAAARAERPRAGGGAAGAAGADADAERARADSAAAGPPQLASAGASVDILAVVNRTNSTDIMGGGHTQPCSPLQTPPQLPTSATTPEEIAAGAALPSPRAHAPEDSDASAAPAAAAEPLLQQPLVSEMFVSSPPSLSALDEVEVRQVREEITATHISFVQVDGMEPRITAVLGGPVFLCVLDAEGIWSPFLEQAPLEMASAVLHPPPLVMPVPGSWDPSAAGSSAAAIASEHASRWGVLSTIPSQPVTPAAGARAATSGAAPSYAPTVSRLSLAAAADAAMSRDCITASGLARNAGEGAGASGQAVAAAAGPGWSEIEEVPGVELLHAQTCLTDPPSGMPTLPCAPDLPLPPVPGATEAPPQPYARGQAPKASWASRVRALGSLGRKPLPPSLPRQ